MTNDVTSPRSPLREAMRAGGRDVSAIWWWFLLLGVLWIWFGMFVLSYRVGSLAAVAAFVGVAFLFGGFTQLVVATGILTFVWPDITLYVVSVLVAWYLIVFGIIHVVDALAGPRVGWWWTGPLLGIAELALGVWAIRSWERSLLTMVTLVGVWAIVYGVSEIFAAFTLREAGNAPAGRVRQAVPRPTTTASRGQLPCRGRGRVAGRGARTKGGGVSARPQ